MDPLTSHSSTRRRGLGCRELAVGPADGSPPVRRARRDGAAQVEAAAPGGTLPARPARRAHQAQVGHQPVGLVELTDGAGGEVLVPQHLPVAPAQGQDRAVEGLGLRCGVVGRWGLVAVEQHGHHLGDRRRPVRVGGGDAVVEGGERAVVEADVLRPVHQGRPARPVRRGAVGHPHLGQRRRVGQGGVDRGREPAGPQRPHEGHHGAVHPGGRGRHHIPRSTAACTREATPLARTRSWSSRYLSTVPSVAATDASSRADRPRVASASAQSMVSATPGGL
jgi:hypothetical protein